MQPDSPLPPAPDTRELPGYYQVHYWRFLENPGVMQRMLIMAVAVLVGVYFATGPLMRLWHPAEVLNQARGIVVDLIVLFAVVVVMVVVHEAIHGVAMAAFGAKPKFGILWQMGAAYATAPGHAFTRGQFLVVALAPLVVMTPPLLLGMAVLPTFWAQAAQLMLILNASGAAGDLLMSWEIMSFPAQAMVMDEMDGVRIFMPGDAESN